MKIADQYEKYQHSMLWLALQIVGNYHDAEDIVSDSWLSVCLHGSRLEGMNEQLLKPYLMQCVRNKAIDFLRWQKRHSEYPYDFNEVSTIPITDIANDENDDFLTDYDLINACSAMLPPREAQAIVMKINGYSTREIAAEMNVALSTVRGYWFRAIRRIRKQSGNLRGT